jgi:hypothetical protein
LSIIHARDDVVEIDLAAERLISDFLADQRNERRPNAISIARINRMTKIVRVRT